MLRIFEMRSQGISPYHICNKLNDGKYRLAELEKLIQSVYEDKVLANIPENLCINLLTKYETEQKKLTETVAEISERLSAMLKTRMTLSCSLLV
jgi:hypothetical protein